LSDFLLDLHQSLAHQGLAKSLDISIGMPALFANLAAFRKKSLNLGYPRNGKHLSVPAKTCQKYIIQFVVY